MTREHHIGMLYAELVGPFGNINETIKDIKPQGLYITGVLGPETLQPEGETVGEDLRGTDEVGEEDFVDSDVRPVYSQNPLIDPQALSKSIGLTFSVKSTESLPDFSVCITWARYFQIPGNASKRFVRYYCEENFISANFNSLNSLKNQSSIEKKLYVEKSRLQENAKAFVSDGESSNSELEASLIIEIVPCSGSTETNCIMVNIYFKNAITDSETPPKTESHLFQPQIRVKLEPQTELVPFSESGADLLEDPEDRIVNFLFRKAEVYARGHMVSALWSKIDPEQEARKIESSGRLEELRIDPEVLKRPPFYWVDGDVLPQNLKEKFTSADVRTEFIPLVQVSFPSIGWPKEYQVKEPLLEAEKLAETWDAQTLMDSLKPFVEVIEKWKTELEQKRLEEEKVDRKWSNMYSEAIENVEKTRNRIKKGIEILYTDSKARLAFCFMNKAMSMGYRWSKKKISQDLIWKPFQLAFILMEIPDIVDQKSEYRNTVDTLW
ncbi:MAG: hypothetical protein ACP5UV_06600, partial [Thermoplasmata archaeon]